MAGFIVVYYVYNCDRKLSRYFKILCALFFIGIVFYFAAQFVPNLANIITRFQSTAETGDITVGRADRYAKVWELFLDHPFFGIGWNGTVYYFRNIEDLAINAHNIYLQLLCETGVIGSVFYFLFFGYTLFCAITTLQQARKRIIILNSEQTCMLSLSLYLQMFFLFYGITGNPLYDSQALFPYLAAAAIANYYRCNYAIVKKKR